ENFGAIKIDYAAVVAQQAQGETAQYCRIGKHERVPEIVGRILGVFVRPEIEHRFLIAVAVAELRLAGIPTTIVEGAASPGGALVAAVVEVFPDRAGRHEDKWWQGNVENRVRRDQVAGAVADAMNGKHIRTGGGQQIHRQ